MMLYEDSIIIHCPVEQVWAFLTTVENLPRWDQGVVSASQTSPGPVGLGTTIQTQRQGYGRTSTGTYRIAAYQPLKKVALETKLGSILGELCYTFEPVSEGTKLTAQAGIKPTGFSRLFAPLLFRLFRASSEEDHVDLSNIKRILETGS